MISYVDGFDIDINIVHGTIDANYVRVDFDTNITHVPKSAMLYAHGHHLYNNLILQFG